MLLVCFSASLQRLAGPRVREGVTLLVRSDLLGLILNDEGLVDVGDHTTAGNRSLNQGVQLFVAADGELKVTGGHSLHLKVLACVSCELEHLSGEVLEDGGSVDSGRGSDAAACAHSALEEAVDSAHGELSHTIAFKLTNVSLIG